MLTLSKVTLAILAISSIINTAPSALARNPLKDAETVISQPHHSGDGKTLILGVLMLFASQAKAPSSRGTSTSMVITSKFCICPHKTVHNSWRL